MTNELLKILSSLMKLMKEWNLDILPREKEFIGKLRKLNNEMYQELEKQKLPEIKE